MFEQVLPKTARESLALLGQSGILQELYLAGGTALALQIGHRVSVDFDFFTERKFISEDLVRQLAEADLGFKLDSYDNRNILGYVNQTKFSLFFYDYPLIDKLIIYSDINLASLKDIAAMKLAAVSDRGLKRDFIDLYFLMVREQLFSLNDILTFYDEKYGVLAQNKQHLLRSLVYFKDADTDETPKMLKEIDWHEVINFFEKEVRQVAKNLIQ